MTATELARILVVLKVIQESLANLNARVERLEASR